jgi:hypothetical protein
MSGSKRDIDDCGRMDKNDVKNASMTCGVCFTVCFFPKTLPCEHSFCAGCFNDSVNPKSDSPYFACPVCTLRYDRSKTHAINSKSVWDSINTTFPYYNGYRLLMQSVSEKRMYLELHTLRTRLTKLRGAFLNTRKEKTSIIGTMTVQFTKLLDLCRVESALNREYNMRLRELEMMEEELEVHMLPDNVETLPSKRCCLQSFARAVEDTILSQQYAYRSDTTSEVGELTEPDVKSEGQTGSGKIIKCSECSSDIDMSLTTNGDPSLEVKIKVEPVGIESHYTVASSLLDTC